MSLRLRLTIWYTIILAATLISYSTFTFVLVRHNLIQETDRALLAKTDEVIRSLRTLSKPLRQQLIVLPNVDVFAAPDTYIQVVDEKGDIVARSQNLGQRSLPADQKPDIQPQGRTGKTGGYLLTVDVEGNELRLYNYPLVVNRQVQGMIQVARTLHPLKATLERLRQGLLLVGSFFLLVAAVLGYLLGRVALRPIGNITAVAANIGAARDLEQRVPYQGPPDEVGRLAATFNDMLDRLNGAYQQLEEASASQRRFIADASHELRTPLTTIRGNVEYLLRATDAPDLERMEALGDIASEASRMSRLIAQMLDLARADADQRLILEPVQLGPLVQEVCHQADRLTRGQIFIKSNLEVLDEAWVKGDRDHLKELYLILLDNAFKYTAPGSIVELLASQGQGEMQGFWGITIRDSGAGISPGDLTRIFERFFRADAARHGSGSGLGLAIAKWIAEVHGGRITAESAVGLGSSFSVWLPAAKI